MLKQKVECAEFLVEKKEERAFSEVGALVFGGVQSSCRKA
jgi:hypothetical protein